MSTLSNKLVAACMVTAISMVMYGCGGGGGGSSDDEMTMMPPPPEMCPEGEEGTPPNCTPIVTGPTEEEVTKAAGTKRDAIKAEYDQNVGGTNNGIGGDDGTYPPTTDPVAGEYNLNIEHGKTEIVKEAAAADDNQTFTQAMDLGGGTTMHVLTMDADDDGNVVEEVVMVHTDIEAPTATAFAMVTGQTLDARDLDTNADGPDGDGNNANDFTALTLTSVGFGGTNLAKIMASAFDPVANVPSKSFAFDDAGTTNMDEAFEAPGTYNGAPGTYRCDGTAACTVVYTDGEISEMTGTWVFTPDAGATSDVPDSEYLAYGFWLQRTTDKDGVLTYNEVETFAEARGQTATGGTSGITGSATYSGDALGVYVHSVHDPDGTEASATSGHFTADVALTAYFGQTTKQDIAPTLLNSITGTINNFMLSGHDTGPGWSVSLEKDTDTRDGTPSGVAKGGGAGGNYSATFYGGNTTDDEAPDAIVGEFNAFFSNGSVAGGFGATKDDE